MLPIPHIRRIFLSLLLVLLSIGRSSPAAAGDNAWTSLGPPGATIFSLAIAPTAPPILYAAKMDGPLYKSTDGGGTWVTTGRSNVYTLAIDPTTPSTLYAGIDYLYGGSVFKSTDGGDTWHAANTGLTNPNVNALVIDRDAPATVLYAATYGGGMFKSTNGGDNWIAVNDGLTSQLAISLAIAPAAQPRDPLAATTLYVGTTDSGVFKSTNGGTSWSQASTGLTAPWIYALAIDPVTPATLYAGTDGGGVFKSTNGGETWATANLGLNNWVVSALVVDPYKPSTLYAGTDGGVFKSTDSGASWTALNTGLTTPEVWCLAIAPAAEQGAFTLYAGTDGGGVFAIQQFPIVYHVVGYLPLIMK
jgi:photosystem II stability/assembly factor-like uncharacterized protein